jgi:dTMP kinase
MLDNYLRAKGKGGVLDAETLHILFAANRWESAVEMYQRLLAGQDVVLDRYAYSGIAYSAGTHTHTHTHTHA